MLDRLSAWSLKERSPAFVTVFTAGSFVIALALRFVADDLLPPGFPYLTFFPAVILTGFICGTRAGTVEALLCGLAAWYFFIAPENSFALGSGTLVALLFYAFVVATELFLIALMRRAVRRMRHEADRAAKLAETNTLMFHELQHRVSNNLQVVAALLKLQRRNVADPAAQAALDAASARLDIVARVQRQLHDPARQDMDLAVFLAEMVPDVLATAGPAGKVDLKMETQPLRIRPDQSIPLALVCTELIANAVEHGPDDSGHLHLTVRCAPTQTGEALLEVSDGGPGLPADFDLEQSRSLGLRIARQFAVQLGGQLTMTNRGGQRGTRALLQFPLMAG